MQNLRTEDIAIYVNLTLEKFREINQQCLKLISFQNGIYTRTFSNMLDHFQIREKTYCGGLDLREMERGEEKEEIVLKP